MASNMNVKGNFKGVGVAEDGSTITQIFHKQHQVPQQLTSTLGKDNIIGREKELKAVSQRLNSDNALLLINGIGGIGKSTLASYYLHSQKDQFDYYGFFNGLAGES